MPQGLWEGIPVPLVLQGNSEIPDNVGFSYPEHTEYALFFLSHFSLHVGGYTLNVFSKLE
jgi:hypothetical protein